MLLAWPALLPSRTEESPIASPSIQLPAVNTHVQLLCKEAIAQRHTTHTSLLPFGPFQFEIRVFLSLLLVAARSNAG